MGKSNVIVYETHNYIQFKKLLGNRAITEERVKAIVDSINQIGQRMSIIIVNKNMEIIDGQGRLEAFKRLGLPVFYVIDSDAGIDECIAMNIKMKNWNLGDFVKSYADRSVKEHKFEDYAVLVELHDKYSFLSMRTIANIMNGTIYNGSCDKPIKNGSYKISHLEEGKKCLDFLSTIHPSLGQVACRNSSVYDVLQGLFFNKLIDTQRMTEQLGKYASECGSFLGNTDSCLTALQKVYNYKKRQPTYFKDKYIEIMQSRGRHKSY